MGCLCSIVNILRYPIWHLLLGTVCVTAQPLVHTWRQNMPTTKTRQADQRHSEREFNVVSIKNSAHGEHKLGSFGFLKVWTSCDLIVRFVWIRDIFCLFNHLKMFWFLLVAFLYLIAQSNIKVYNFNKICARIFMNILFWAFFISLC